MLASGPTWSELLTDLWNTDVFSAESLIAVGLLLFFAGLTR